MLAIAVRPASEPPAVKPSARPDLKVIAGDPQHPNNRGQ
jgi:hypothetical protein